MGEKLRNELTDKEREMYEYIVKYMEENLISPSFQEICKGVNTKPKSCVHDRLKKLMGKGYITLREGGTKNNLLNWV